MFFPLGGARLSAGFFDARARDRFGGALLRLFNALGESHADTTRPILGPASELSRLDPAHATEILFLSAALLQVQGEGSTRLDLVGASFEKRLGNLGATREEIAGCRALASSASPLIGLPGQRRPLIVDGEHLYFERVLRLEIELAQALHWRFGGEVASSDGDVALPPLPGERRLNREQGQAVRRVLSAARGGRGGIVLITGGPGTGKTFVVASLMRALARGDWMEGAGAPIHEVAFAAPTGKAADRMGQAIREALALGLEAGAAGGVDHRIDQALIEMVEGERARPKTLHRLLGYRPARGDFRFHAKNPLPVKLLIVDEASMIDLSMMRRILVALPPDAVLVLLGDADQLPSVDAGAVLRDLVSSDDPRLMASTVRLRKSHRQDQGDPAGSAILGAAQAINAGTLPGAEHLVGRASAAEVEFRGVEHLDGALPALLERWFEASFEELAQGGRGDFASLVRREYRIEPREDGLTRFSEEDTARLQALFACAQRRKVLCVTRAQVDAINRWFHERHSGDVRLFGERRGAFPFERTFVPGEPLMMCVNDSARGLFNGDQGMVLRVADPSGAQAFQAVFPAGLGFRAFKVHALRDNLVHAFAMTVHKSQGSEYERVLFALPHQDTPLLTREITYTALTRAKRSVVIHGARDLLATSATRRATRSTGLAERIVRARVT